MLSVLFVCLGNICRSPTAHGVFEQLVKDKQLDDFIKVDSAGTAGWHIDHAPDPRTIAAASSKGYDLSHLRSRKVMQNDFSEFNYIIAMDSSNLTDLRSIVPDVFSGDLSLFLDYSLTLSEKEVPDPYYCDGDSFQYVLSLVEQASHDFLDHLIKRHNL